MVPPFPFTHRQALYNSLTKVVSTPTTYPTAITFDHPHLHHLHTPATITTALTQAHCLYLIDITMHLAFAEWRTSLPHTPHITPKQPSSTAQWNKYSPSILPHPLAAVPTPIAYTSQFTIPNTLHSSDHTINPRASHTLPSSNNNLLTLPHYYTSPLIITIDASYNPLIEPIVFQLPQPHTTNAGCTVASAVFLAINNITHDNA